MAIAVNWPHSYATILKNTKTVQLKTPWLGRHGVTFRPQETIILVGNPLIAANNPIHYNGKTSIMELAKLVAAGTIEVLSIPGGPNEKTNTEVPVVDANGKPLPGCRIEF